MFDAVYIIPSTHSGEKCMKLSNHHYEVEFVVVASLSEEDPRIKKDV